MFRKRIVETQEIPFWYGVAYYDWVRAEMVLYPVPFHLVVSLFRIVWWGFKMFFIPTQADRIFKKGYMQGKVKLDAMEYQKGFEEGYNKALTSLLDRINKRSCK